MTTRVLVLGHAAIGLLFLVTRLGLLWRFPVHVDEATFGRWALAGYEQPGPALFQPLAGGQQPLLPWLGAAAMNLGVEPVTALRLVTLVASLATLALVAVAAHRWFGPEAGLLAAALYAIVPFTFVYGVLGLYDPLAAFFVFAALVLQHEHARRPRLDLALLLGLTLAGGVLTKLTAYSALYLLPLSALVFDWSPTGRGRRLLAWLGGIGVALALAFVASRVLLLSELADDLDAAREQLAQNDLGEALGDPARWAEQNWPQYRDVIAAYLTPPLVVAAVVGLALLLRRSTRTGLFLAGWVVLPLGGLVLLSTTPYGRWTTIVAPQLVLLAAYGLLQILRALAGLRLSPRARRAVVGGAAAIAVVPALVFDLRLLADPTGPALPRIDDEAYVSGYPGGTPWDAVAERLRALAPDGDPVVVAAAPFCCGPLSLVLRHEGQLSVVPVEGGDVPAALYGLENGIELPRRADGLSWRRLESFPRPRGTNAVQLYESGVLVDLEFASTPGELRRLVGGGDADFDAFVSARPAVAAWLEAWTRANGS